MFQEDNTSYKVLSLNKNKYRRPQLSNIKWIVWTYNQDFINITKSIIDNF